MKRAQKSHYGSHYLFRSLLSASLVNGATGNVEFNDLGERMHSKYKITNVQKSGLKEIGMYKDGEVKINETVIWPEQTIRNPEGKYLPNHIKVKISETNITFISCFFIKILVKINSGQ